MTGIPFLVGKYILQNCARKCKLCILKMIMQFLRYPKVQLSILLFLIYLSALKVYPNITTIYLMIASITFCITSDLIFTYLRKRVLFIPFAAITTGLIITLTTDVNASWFELAAICVFAMASKNFIRISGRHIFNPAAFGLFFGGVVFAIPVSWWAPISNFQILLPFLILISPALISAYRMRRFVSILTFLISYALLSQSVVGFLDPTALFFSLVMLPEPMTSPFNFKRQAMYGVIVAILSFLLSTNSSIAILLPDVLIPALLLGNLIFFKFK